MTSREEAVRELWRARPRNRFLRGSVLLLVLLGVLAWVVGDFRLADLSGPTASANLARFLHRAVPRPLQGQPWDAGVFLDWLGEYLRAKGLHAAALTLAISVAAIVLAGLMALLVALPAARTFATPEPFLPGAGVSRASRLAWRGLVGATRTVLVFLRALPEYVWAFLLVAVLGPRTAWPAVLALAIHNTGILGKLYAETLENAPRAPLAALRGLGAGRRQLALVAGWPGGFGRLLLYFFYRWETCVREATVLGMLGIVSIGYYIETDAQVRFRYDEVLLLVALGAALVMGGDLLSALARRAARRAG